MKKENKVVRVKAEKRPAESPVEVPEKLKKKRRANVAPKKVKIEVNGAEKTLENLEVTKEHVVKCVNAILELAEKSEKKTTLLSDDEKILLQVNSIKIPKIPQRILRPFLPHSMVGPNDDVALIVPDITKGLRQDYEKTVDHWETILRDKGVTQIKDILPMNKIKTEYHQFEMQRKLARLYDFFLVDGKIAGHMSHLLGESFRRFATPPVPIKLSRDNLKDEIEFGLKKTSMKIHSNGNTHTVQVATSSMKKKDIVENVMAACEELAKLYPGGFSNIRSILIKTKQGLGIPIYYSIINKNKVEIPIVERKRPKAYKTVEGELSTLESDATVKVTPGGRVKIEVKKSEDENEKTEPEQEEKMEVENATEKKEENIVKVKNLTEKKKKKKQEKRVENHVKVENVTEKKKAKNVTEKKKEKNVKVENVTEKKKKNEKIEEKNVKVENVTENKKKNEKIEEKNVKVENVTEKKKKNEKIGEKNVKVENVIAKKKMNEKIEKNLKVKKVIEKKNKERKITHKKIKSK